MPLLLRRLGATRQTARHRILLEIEVLRADGVAGHAELARALAGRGIPTPRGRAAWTHTTVARLLARAGENGSPCQMTY